MAKKQTEEQEVDGGMLSQVDIIAQKTNQGIKYLDGIQLEQSGVPEHIYQVLAPWVRDGRVEFDKQTEIIESTDKSSEENATALRNREKIVKSFMTADSQIQALNTYTGELKATLPSISEGTKEENVYKHMLVGGGQADGVGFSPEGRLSFAGRLGMGQDISTFKLDDMLSLGTGDAPIVTEPAGSKALVWKMAEKVKEDANAGKPFDENWTYTRVHNNLTEGGPQNTIGIAFADLAGDNQSKSFAKMYEEGLADQSYYINPETGNVMPSDSSWMKNPINANVLKKFLGKYITSIMKDVHGPTIDEETGQVKKSQSQLAMDLIKKYKK